MDIASLVEKKRNPKIPDIAPGDTVKVSARIVEGGKERIQVFQGVVIQVKKGGASANFTVRHVAFGIGVERTFPYYSPLVEKVEIVRHGKVRRARLYYLRGLSSRQARRKIKRVEKKVEIVGAELLETESEEVLEPQEVLGEDGEMVAVKPEPEAELLAEEPKVEETVAEGAPVEEPKAVEEPAAEEAAAEPKGEEPMAETAPIEKPKAVEESAAEEAAAESKAEEPVAEAAPVEEPKAVEESAAEEAAAEPKLENEKS